MITSRQLIPLTAGLISSVLILATIAPGQSESTPKKAETTGGVGETKAVAAIPQGPREPIRNLPGIKLPKTNLSPLPRELAEPIGLPAQDQQIFDKLRSLRVSLTATNMPLTDVVANLRDQTRINVLLDKPSLEEEGVTTNTPITANITDARLDHALARILDQYNLTFIVKHGVLMITSQLAAGNELVTRVYPVADLVWSQDPGPETPADFDTLIEIVEQTLSPNSWSCVGGAGTIEPFTRTLSLVVNQTLAVHNQIAETLDILRMSRQGAAEPKSLVQNRDKPEPPTSRLVAGMGLRELELIKFAHETPVSVKFVETPLTNILGFLREFTKLQFDLDRASLEEEGVTLDTPMSIELTDRPLASVLNLLLNQYNLTWLIRNDVIVITSMLQAGNDLRTLAYTVPDLVVLSDGVDRWSVYQCELMEILHQTASPNSWSSVGGAGTVQYFPASQTLVVNQTREVHREIQELLGMLRESLARLPSIVQASGLPAVEKQDQWRLKEALAAPHARSQKAASGHRDISKGMQPVVCPYCQKAKTK